MQSTELLKEAERVMRICNACRYCEGYCAVFPAMERRRTFSPAELRYLANLCHNCRGCYYACQYAPPHEFDLNVPRTMQRLRLETYKEWAWPEILAGLFHHNGLVLGLAAAALVLATLVLLFLVDPTRLLSAQQGAGSFYRVIPFGWMVSIPSLFLGFALLAIAVGVGRCWRQTGAGEGARARAWLGAVGDALRLKYLQGGGHGCPYPDERFSGSRRWLHHLVFYGFGLCGLATTVAAVYEHLLHRVAPYPWTSLPVILGALGGLGVVLGTAGLVWYKWGSDPEPAEPGLAGMDLMFSLLLFLICLSGLFLLLLRETMLMGLLLAVHFGLVLALFAMLPCCKFVHAVYRLIALLRNRIEAEQEGDA